jgi:TonB family protein
LRWIEAHNASMLQLPDRSSPPPSPEPIPSVAGKPAGCVALSLPPRQSDRLLRASGFVFAIALHIAALLAVTRLPAGHAGARGEDFGSVSVEVTLVPAAVLESRIKSDAAAEGATGATDEMEGATKRDAMGASKSAEQAAAAPSKDIALAMANPAPAAMVDRERKETKVEQEDKHNEKADEASIGGTLARSDVPSTTTAPGVAIASAGDVRRYASSLAEALGRAKPRGIGIRGTVRLRFAVAPDGSLESLSVLQSSGSQRLDQVAVDALRRAALPAPPGHMTALQRTFELPYRFR